MTSRGEKLSPLSSGERAHFHPADQGSLTARNSKEVNVATGAGVKVGSLRQMWCWVLITCNVGSPDGPVLAGWGWIAAMTRDLVRCRRFRVSSTILIQGVLSLSLNALNRRFEGLCIYPHKSNTRSQ